MASYIDLKTLFQDPELGDKVAVACVIAAETIRNEDPTTVNHAARLLWAKAAFANPQSKAIEMLRMLLAVNKDLDVATIQDASDAAIQSQVDAAVDVFTA